MTPPALSLQQAKFTLYRCAVLLRWRLRHTLFCTLAWERGLSARHFLWTCLVRGLGHEGPAAGGWGAGPGPPVCSHPARTPPGLAGEGPGPPSSKHWTMLSPGQMTHSQEEFGIHLAQALSYLHSRHRHIKTWAALFIGERVPGPAPAPRPSPAPGRPLAPAREERRAAGEGPGPGRAGAEPHPRSPFHPPAPPSAAQVTPSATTPRPCPRW